MSFSELKYDFHVSLKSKTNVVFVAMIKNSLNIQYRGLMDACELKMDAFEPEGFCLLQNIPFNFNTDDGVMVIDIRGGHVNFLTIWEGDIFDSSSLTSAEIESNPSIVATEVGKISRHFGKISKRKISKVLLSGPKQESEKIAAQLGDLPMAAADKYKVNIDQENSEKFKVVSGLALQGLGQPKLNKLNLSN